MWIEFSEINYKLLFFLIYPMFRRVQDYTNCLYIKDDNILFKTFRYFLSFFFSGIFLLIFKYKTEWEPKQIISDKKNLKKEEKEEIEITNYSNNLNQIEIIQKSIEKKRKIISALYLFFLCTIGLFSYYGRYYFSDFLVPEYKYLNHSLRTFFELIIYSALSYLLIKQKLYKHHIISFLFITLMLSIIFAISIPHLRNILYPSIFFLLSESVFALFDVMAKRYMNVCYKNHYFIMFFIGVIITPLLLFYDMIVYFLKPSVSGIIIGFDENIKGIVDVLKFILDLLVEYLWNLGIWLLIFYYTPCHFFVSEYASQFIYFIIKAYKEEGEFYYKPINCIMISICYIIIFFFCLIFNEVLILNFCGLDYNTRKRISEREKTEYNDIKENGIVIRESVITEESDEDVQYS